MSADVEALPNEHDLVDGQCASVGVADINGQPHLFVSVTAKVPDAHLLDGWILPASSELLRGIARDLVAGADARDERIWELAAGGAGLAEIARAVGISTATVRRSNQQSEPSIGDER